MDTARRLDFHVFSDVFFEKFHVFKSCARLRKSRRRFDIIGVSVGNCFAHCDFFFVGQKTGFDDDFQDFFAAGVFQKSDFVGNFFKVMLFHVADIDNHIDFVCALFQRLFRLKEFDVGGVVAVGEPDDRADAEFVPDVLFRALHK